MIPKFIYFNFPFWRAEVGKIALFMGNIEFEDIKVEFDEFARLKKTGNLDDGTPIPFHQLPCLVFNGQSIAQTGGIARLCGKLGGIYPDDYLLAAQTDQFLDFATDITNLVFYTGRDLDEKSKKECRRKISDGELLAKLELLEKNISAHDKWVIGNQIGLADIAVWRLMGWLSGGILDGIPETILDPFPRIKRLCIAVDSHELVVDWVQKTYPQNYNRGYFRK